VGVVGRDDKIRRGLAESLVSLEPVDAALTGAKAAALHDAPELLPAPLKLTGSMKLQVGRCEVRVYGGRLLASEQA
jgi:hypothetical protein